MSTTLVLTRHGLTARSRPEQHLGQRIDIPLDADGRRQGRALAARLGGVRFERVFSSPLARARETALIVAADQPITIDSRLAEMDYGRWEGLTYDEVESLGPAERRRWEDDPEANACPGGESGGDVAARAMAFLADLVDGGGTVLAVGHSTLNRILLCVALGVPVRDYRRRFVQAQTNLTVLRWADSGTSRATLLLLNDTAHLQRRGANPWGE